MWSIILWSLLIITTLILVWPQWFGVDYENELMRFVWRIPPFTFKMSKLRIRIFFLEKEIGQYGGDRHRRKKVRKRAEARAAAAEEKISSEESAVTDEKPQTEKTRTVTPIPSSILKERSVITQNIEEKIEEEKIEEEIEEEKIEEEKIEEEKIEEEKIEEEKIEEEKIEEEKIEEVKIEEVKIEEEKIEEEKIEEETDFFGFRFVKKRLTNLKNKIVAKWHLEKDFIKANWRWFILFLKITFKLIKPTTFRINLSGGLEDPAYTGALYGVLTSISSPTKSYSKNYINYEPDFMGETPWKYSGDILWKTSLLAFLYWVFLSLITFPYIQAYKFYRRRQNGDVSENS